MLILFSKPLWVTQAAALFAVSGWQGSGIGGGWQGPAEHLVQYRGRWLRCRLGGCDTKGALSKPGVRGRLQYSVSHTHSHVLGSRRPSLSPNLVSTTVRRLEDNLFSYRLQWPFHPPESPGARDPVPSFGCSSLDRNTRPDPGC